MALSPRTARALERAYDEWREEETRAALARDVARACAEAPDTRLGREEVAYQQLRARFSPAYFSGSGLYRGPRLLRSRAFQREQDEALRRDVGRLVALRLARYARASGGTSVVSDSLRSSS